MVLCRIQLYNACATSLINVLATRWLLKTGDSGDSKSFQRLYHDISDLFGTLILSSGYQRECRKNLRIMLSSPDVRLLFIRTRLLFRSKSPDANANGSWQFDPIRRERFVVIHCDRRRWKVLIRFTVSD